MSACTIRIIRVSPDSPSREYTSFRAAAKELEGVDTRDLQRAVYTPTAEEKYAANYAYGHMWVVETTRVATVTVIVSELVALRRDAERYRAIRDEENFEDKEGLWDSLCITSGEGFDRVVDKIVEGVAK